MNIFETNPKQVEMSEVPESTEKEMELSESDPPGWRSGLGLRKKAKAFVKHFDGARKMIEDSLHNFGDKIGNLQGNAASSDPAKDSEHSSGSKREASPEINLDPSEPSSAGPESASQDSSGVEILGPLSRDVHERFEGAKKILKSSMASIGDTAGSLLRFNVDTPPAGSQDGKDDTESDEISVAPIPPPSPPPFDPSDSTAATTAEGIEAGQKNVWNPIRKAIDGIVQPSQQIGKHLIQVWDLHDLVDDLKEQRNLWRQRKAKESKESESQEVEGQESNVEPAAESADTTAVSQMGPVMTDGKRTILFL
jgi:hypothetical protein